MAESLYEAALRAEPNEQLVQVVRDVHRRTRRRICIAIALSISAIVLAILAVIFQ